MTTGKGRKTPNQIKRLKGTDQKVRLDEEVNDLPTFNELPEPPIFFSEVSKLVYNKLGEILRKRKILNQLTYTSFTMYCQYYGMWYDFFNNDPGRENLTTTITDRNGNLIGRKSIDFRIAMDAGDRASKMAAEFGFTPISMGRIAHLLNLSKESQDPYEKFKNSI